MPVDEFGREIIPSLYTGLIGSGSGRPADIAAAIRRRSPSPSAVGYHSQHRYSYNRSPPGTQTQRFGYNNRSPGRFASGPHSNSNSAGEFKAGGKHKNQHYLSAPVTSLLPKVAPPFNSSTINASDDSPQALVPEQKKHPSFSYVEEPLACAYLWKHSELAEVAKKSADLEMHNSAENLGDVSDNANVISETDDDTILTKLYDEYRKLYCLNYIRSFFNKHLDDSWFRQRFSPSVRKKSIVDPEQIRASTEAQVFKQQAISMVDFLSCIRLGDGIKQNQINASNQSATSTSPSPRKQNHLSESDHHNAVPVQHLFSFQQARTIVPQRQQSQEPQPIVEMFSALHVVDIPSHATDEHVAIALVDQYNSAAVTRVEKLLAQQNQSADKSSGNDTGDESAPNGKDPNDTLSKKGAKGHTPIPAPTLLRLNEITIYPAPATLLSDGPSTTILNRQVLAVGPAFAITEIVVSLRQIQDAKMSDATVAGSVTGATSKRSVPRKGDSSNNPEAFYHLFDLEVECTDPYGRIDYDADGRGGATTDNQSIPRRKAVVGVCPVHTFFSLPPNADTSSNHNNINLATANLRKQHQDNVSKNHPLHPFPTTTVVLSAAVSSRTRIEQDQKSARKIAQALDTKKRIPEGCRLEDIIQQLFPSNDTSLEDILDVSIAYLRRIHLLSFYNGCTEAETIGDVLAGKHPTSAVYLRLQNADDYIVHDNDKPDRMNEMTEDEQGTVKQEERTDIEGKALEETTKLSSRPNKDMLVQRLDDSISRSLEYCRKWLDIADDDNVPGMLDEATEQSAKEIEIAEENVRDKWVNDHCIMDADGRARCSFQFCHKLFKDANFLEKHLLKKHSEFLRAERAKCHDMHMMMAWDACESRPVPPILVDCGSHFGCVSASIIASAEPDVIDPEPELWQREEEKRQRDIEMQRKREELRQQHNELHNINAHHHHNKSEYSKREYGGGSSSGGGDGHSMQRQSRGGGFVDVDDMKVEKVELSFDAVEVDPTTLLAAAGNKKKKKRKLL